MTVTVDIDQKWHKLVIGANGENMRELRDRFPGVHVAFPEQGLRSNHVTLRGPTEEVNSCANYLRRKAKDIVSEREGRKGERKNWYYKYFFRLIPIIKLK